MEILANAKHYFLRSELKEYLGANWGYYNLYGAFNAGVIPEAICYFLMEPYQNYNPVGFAGVNKVIMKDCERYYNNTHTYDEYLQHLAIVFALKREIKRKILNSKSPQKLKEFVEVHSQPPIDAFFPLADYFPNVYSGKNIFEFEDGTFRYNGKEIEQFFEFSGKKMILSCRLEGMKRVDLEYQSDSFFVKGLECPGCEIGEIEKFGIERIVDYSECKANELDITEEILSEFIFNANTFSLIAYKDPVKIIVEKADQNDIVSLVEIFSIDIKIELLSANQFPDLYSIVLHNSKDKKFRLEPMTKLNPIVKKDTLKILSKLERSKYIEYFESANRITDPLMFVKLVTSKLPRLKILSIHIAKADRRALKVFNMLFGMLLKLEEIRIETLKPRDKVFKLERRQVLSE